MLDFNSIRKIKDSGSYNVNVPLERLSNYLEGLNEDFGLIMKPDFQRDLCWSEEQKTAYMEFVLRGGKTAKTFYFNSPAFGNYTSPATDLGEEILCIDGLQRITTALEFLQDKVEVFGGYTYSQIENYPKNTVHFEININNMKTKNEIVEWYIDYNSGGTVHSEEDLERAKKLLK